MDATAPLLPSTDANAGWRWPAVAVILLGVSLAAIRLSGPSDLMDNEQQLQSAYVMDALQNGHWLCQRDETGSITSKPPVYTWLAAAMTLPTGRISRLSMCLPSVLGTIGLALLLLHFGRKQFNPEAGLLAAMAYLLSYPIARQIGLARMDGLFPFTTTLTALAAFVAWRRGHGWIWFWIAAAVGTLTKGPVTLVVGAGGLGAILWERAGQRTEVKGLRTEEEKGGDASSSSPQSLVLSPQSSTAEHAAGIIVFLFLTVGWFAASCEVMGRPVYQKLILDGLLGQSVQSHNGHWPGQQFYAPPLYLLSRFLPWSAFTCMALWRIIRHPAQGDAERRFERFTACWLGIGIIPFCIASHQRADLISPIYPPAALLAGRELARLVWPPGWRVPATVAVATAALAMLIAKYDIHARGEPAPMMTVAIRDLADSVDQQVGRDFPITHVDDPFALQFYLNTMRPVVSYARGAELLDSEAAAFVAVAHPESLPPRKTPGERQVYDLVDSTKVFGHHGVHILSNRPTLQAEKEMTMAVGSLVLTTDGLRWVHAAEHDFTFAGRGTVKYRNVGNEPVRIRIVMERSGAPLGEVRVLQPGEAGSFYSGG